MTHLPPPTGSFPWTLYIPGAAVMGFGVLILLFPQLLAVLVAGMLMLVGFGLLGAAEHARRTGGRGGYSQVITILKGRQNPFQ